MTRTPNIIDFAMYKRDFHNPLFNIITDEFDNAFKEKNVTDEYIIENYYVDLRPRVGVIGDETASLFKTRPKILGELEDFTDDLGKRPGMMYLLLGKKGIGKTIFLKHYVYQMAKEKKYPTSKEDIVIYTDLKNRKTDKNFLESLPGSLMRQIFDYLSHRDEKIAVYLTQAERIRDIDPRYKAIKDDSILVQRVLDKQEEAVEFLLYWAQKNRYEVTLIVDNIDDFPITKVRAILDKCAYLKDHFSVRCIIALRDYWHPRQLNIRDANYCSYELGKPDIYEVIKRRLKSINTKNINKRLSIKYEDRDIILTPEDLVDIFDKITKDILDNQDDLHEELYRLANYNTREHLLNFYHFFHSPYLFSRPNFIRKIIEEVKKIDPDFKIENPRPIKFFDFIECFMAVHSLCYDITDSEIFNIFYHEYHYDDGPNYRNTLIFLRILQMFPQTGLRLSKQVILDNLSLILYDVNAIIDALNKLLDAALLESPDGTIADDADSLSISTKGLVYRERLIYEYSYLLFVSDAVALEKKYKSNIIEKFGSELLPLERGNLLTKHDSVRKFVNFIHEEEDEEKNNCPRSHLSILKRIKNETDTHEKMREMTEATMRKMMKSGARKARAIQKITLIDID